MNMNANMNVNMNVNMNANSNSVTFIIKQSKKTNYIYNLYCIDNNNKIKKYSVARIDSISKKEFIEKELLSCKKHLFIECIYSSEFKKWIPQKVSSQDKLAQIKQIQYIENK